MIITYGKYYNTVRLENGDKYKIYNYNESINTINNIITITGNVIDTCFLHDELYDYDIPSNILPYYISIKTIGIFYKTKVRYINSCWYDVYTNRTIEISSTNYTKLNIKE